MKNFVFCFVLFSHLTAKAVKHGEMVYGENARLEQIDPYTVHESSAQRLSDLLFNSLVDIGPGYEYVSSLAKNWTIDSKRTKIRVHLRDDVYWHDSLPNKEHRLSADDVIATLRILTSKESEITNQDRFMVISRAEKIDPLTVDIYFSYAVFDPLKYLLFKVLPEDSFKSDKYLSRKHAFTKKPIGTGPFKLEAFSDQGEVKLSRNDKYFAKVANMSSIMMRSFADQSVLSKSLMYAALDLATYVSPRDIVEIAGDKRLGVIAYDALSYSFIGFNTSRPFLKDKRVRQALSYAVDRKEMLDAFFQGQGELISGPFPPSSWAYNLDIKPMDYDTKRAQLLLESSNILKQQTAPLVFAVPISGDNEMIKRIVLAYQNYLAQIGVRVELEFMDWLVWKKRVLEDHNYDLTIASWSFDDASNIKSLFHSSDAKKWGHNFVLFQNQNVDMLLNEAEVTNDPDKRKMIYQKLHAVLADEAPYTYLWTLKHHAAYQKRLQRVQIEPYSFFKHIVSWYDAGEQTP